MILLYSSDRLEEVQIFTFGEQFSASIVLVRVGAELSRYGRNGLSSTSGAQGGNRTRDKK